MSAIRVKLCTKYAKAPIRGTKFAAGLDLFAAHDLTIKAGQKGILDTGIAVEFPPLCYGRIAPRSGMSCKKHFLIGAGVIDRDYTGTIKILICNIGKNDIKIKIGDSYAQLILEKIYYSEVQIVDNIKPEGRNYEEEINKHHTAQQTQ